MTASSLHVVPVVSVHTRAELDQALTAGAFILGVTSLTGKLDVSHVADLAARGGGACEADHIDNK